MKIIGVLAAFAFSGTSFTCAAEVASKSANSGGTPADLTKPVKVFVMLGQSNMVGMGHIAGDKPGSLQNAVTEQKLYPYLVDDEGQWKSRKDVRYVQVMIAAKMDVFPIAPFIIAIQWHFPLQHGIWDFA